MGFLSSLVSSTDPAADCINVGGLLCIGTLCVVLGYDVLWLHQDPQYANFGIAAGGVLAAIGGSKWMRDGRQQSSQGS